jgi:hypothetical protein
MSYKPFKSVGERAFTDLSGSGTLQTVGAATLGAALNVTGALVLDGPATGSAGGPGSYLALNSSGLVVLDTPPSTISNGSPTGCLFSSSIDTTIDLIPTGSGAAAIIPIISASSLLNVTLTTKLTASLTSSGVGGVDVGAAATASKGYYTYVITQADGANPKLLLSQDSRNPTMPGTYTYKSQALFFQFVSSAVTWRDYTNRTDGWTYGRNQIGSNLIEHEAITAVDAQTYVPAGGRFVMYVNGKWDQNNNRTLTIYKNINQTVGHDITGEDDLHESMGTFRLNANGTGDLLRDWTFGLPAPPSSSSDTFYYKWSASMAAAEVACGVDFNAIAWKTEAFCNPQD